MSCHPNKPAAKAAASADSADSLLVNPFVPAVFKAGRKQGTGIIEGTAKVVQAKIWTASVTLSQSGALNGKNREEKVKILTNAVLGLFGEEKVHEATSSRSSSLRIRSELTSSTSTSRLRSASKQTRACSTHTK